MTVIGYASTSTLEQDGELQVDALRRAGAGKVYIDYGVTGVRSMRPNLESMLDQIHVGDKVIVWKMDELALSMPRLVQLVADFFERGVTFRSLSEGVDTSAPNGAAVADVFSALAVFERGIVRDRTGKGLSAARARGRSGGRPSLLNEAAVISAKEMHSAGVMSPKDIAAALGVSVPTLYRYLSK